jgi:hypothetical protein
VDNCAQKVTRDPVICYLVMCKECTAIHGVDVLHEPGSHTEAAQWLNRDRVIPQGIVHPHVDLSRVPVWRRWLNNLTYWIRENLQ